MKTYSRTIDGPMGSLTLVVDETHLREIKWESSGRNDDHELLDKVERQLQEYFRGERKEFDLPLNPSGTPFQQKVWRKLLEIPFAETATYGELAQAIGNKKASRAVGAANGKNPLPIIIPCHRVIGGNGKLVGFVSGLKNKGFMLSLEKKFQ